MGFTVKQARRYAELTQEAVAKALGVSVSTYAKLEKHPELFTKAQAQHFCTAVSISEDEINFLLNNLQKVDYRKGERL